MKYLFPALLTLFLGYLIGNWAPQWESYNRKAKIEELKEELRTRGKSGGGMGLPFLPNQPPEGPIRKVATNTVTKIVTITNEVNLVVTQEIQTAMVSTNEVKESRRERRERWEQMNSRDRMDEMMEIWELRSDVSRDAFLNNINATDQEAAEFDAVVTSMNIALQSYIDSWAGEMQDKPDIYPEDGLSMMRNVMGYIEVGYDQLGKSMPEGWRKDAGADFKLFDFIKPSVGMSMIELEESGKNLDDLGGGPGSW